MFIDLTPEQRALRGELRGYFGGLMTATELIATAGLGLPRAPR
jgi:hypothetical protein